MRVVVNGARREESRLCVYAGALSLSGVMVVVRAEGDVVCKVYAVEMEKKRRGQQYAVVDGGWWMQLGIASVPGRDDAWPKCHYKCH